MGSVGGVTRSWGIAAALACVVAGCGDKTSDQGPKSSHPTRTSHTDRAVVRPGAAFALERIGRFSQPLYVTQPRSDPSRLFVVEKTGRVKVVKNGKVLGAPFLSRRGRVAKLTEQGLLGLAFAPSYSKSRLLYISYTDRKGDLRVEELKASKRNPDTVNRASTRLVLKVPQPAPTHNGGHLTFGPDGLLYIGTGDGGGPGDPRRKGQNRATLLGKLLRIDPRIARGGKPYRAPATNPFSTKKGARDEIYSYGLRNPWRFSFDRETGDLSIGDVGQEAYEEINLRRRGTGKGANFGWSAYEGNHRFNRRIKARRHVPPIHTYGRDDGCSVTGGYVVRDPQLNKLTGRYLYGDFCSGQIRSLKPRLPRARDVRREHVKVPLLSSFGEDAAGRIYVTSLEGPVYRLTRRATR